jgi:hypothetical protein
LLLLLPLLAGTLDTGDNLAFCRHGSHSPWLMLSFFASSFCPVAIAGLALVEPAEPDEEVDFLSAIHDGSCNQHTETDCVPGVVGLEVRRETGKE